jgi:hypothetical protein
MKKALVFTAFDRFVYLKETLDSWSNVRGIEKWDIYFKVEPSDHFDTINDIIKNFEDKIDSSVNIILNNKVLKCAANTWFAFDDLFQKYDFVILAEDDIIVSKDILEYFDYLEEKYRDVKDVSIISANTKWNTSDSEKIIKEQAFNGLVWGTWREDWENYFKDTWDFNYSTGLGGTSSGWDWNITLRVLPTNNLFSIHPYVSRSQHIGINGLHCTPEIFDQTQSPSFKEDNVWERLSEL